MSIAVGDPSHLAGCWNRRASIHHWTLAGPFFNVASTPGHGSGTQPNRNRELSLCNQLVDRRAAETRGSDDGRKAHRDRMPPNAASAASAFLGSCMDSLARLLGRILLASRDPQSRSNASLPQRTVSAKIVREARTERRRFRQDPTHNTWRTESGAVSGNGPCHPFLVSTIS